ncbi:MAG: hypothetical protein K8W52_21675 [Deltaproteobacteria bacterium]|nr:hypothetical protein [Deltaproteobacteria bacterium]
MDTFIIGVLVGALLAFAAVRARAQLGGIGGLLERHVLATPSSPGDGLPADVVSDLRRQTPEFAQLMDAAPAVPVNSVPATLSAASQNALEQASSTDEAERIAARFIPNPQLCKVVAQLARWRTRRGNTESQFQNSFRTQLRRNGFIDTLSEKVRIPWQGAGVERIAVPDFVIGDYVLVELKAALTSSAEVDRALGQMLRYLLAWKRKGPAVLAVCGDVPPEIRWLVLTYVDTWRQHLHLPVMVFFKQGDQGAVADAADMPAHV